MLGKGATKWAKAFVGKKRFATCFHGHMRMWSSGGVHLCYVHVPWVSKGSEALSTLALLLR